MINISVIDNAARIQKAESLKAACEKTSLLTILFPSSDVSGSSTELTKRKRKVHSHILLRFDLRYILCLSLSGFVSVVQQGPRDRGYALGSDHCGVQSSRHVRQQSFLQVLHQTSESSGLSVASHFYLYLFFHDYMCKCFRRRWHVC